MLYKKKQILVAVPTRTVLREVEGAVPSVSSQPI